MIRRSGAGRTPSGSASRRAPLDAIDEMLRVKNAVVRVLIEEMCVLHDQRDISSRNERRANAVLGGMCGRSHDELLRWAATTEACRERITELAGIISASRQEAQVLRAHNGALCEQNELLRMHCAKLRHMLRPELRL